MPRAPGPHARVLDGPRVEWRGAEGERVPDPVTPGVVWLGGARGGSRCEGITHQPAGAPNGGDCAAAPRNLALRDTSLAAIEARAARAQHARTGATRGRSARAAQRAAPRALLQRRAACGRRARTPGAA
jgi:hypothetical protein